MIAFAIDIFEALQAYYSFGGFESERVGLEVCFATSYYIPIVIT